MMKRRPGLALAGLLAMLAAPTWAQDTAMPGMQRDGGMDHDSMSMQGDKAPAGARDPHAYSGGADFGPMGHPHMGDMEHWGAFLLDRLEAVRSDDNTAAAYDLRAWYGGDYDRAVLKAEGDIDDGTLQDSHTDLLWGHAVAAYWDTQLGARYDSGAGLQDRTWLAFGIQGLAPYWFEVDVAGYLGDSGRTSLRLEADYEVLLTQKLILQPRVEANIFGKRDAGHETGSGLSDLSAGLRLRYEIRREFAPYVGIEWAGKYGGTADDARANGEDTKETRVVAGLRAWY